MDLTEGPRPEKITLLLALGDLFTDTGELDQALLNIKAAEEMYEQLGNSQSAEIQTLGSNIDRIYAGYWKEYGDYDKAIDFYQKSLGPDWKADIKKTNDAPVFSNISRIFHLMKKLDSAQYYNQIAIIAATRDFNSMDFNQLPDATDFKNQNIIYQLLKQKAEWLQEIASAEEDPEKRKTILAQAVTTIDLFDQVHNQTLKKVNVLRGAQSNVVIGSSLESYEAGISVAHDLYQLSSSKEEMEKGFYFTQKTKAQQLWLTPVKK